MWCPEGYVTFSQILGQILWDSDLMPTATNRPSPTVTERLVIDTGMPDQAELTAFKNWMSIGFFRIFEEDVRVCLTSGNVVRLDTSLATGLRRDPLDFSYDVGPFPSDYSLRVKLSNWEFIFVDLHYGCIRCPDADSTISRLDGLPVCIKEAHLPVTLEKLPAWLWTEIPKLDARESSVAWSSREGASAIVQAFNSGKIRTKPEAKRMFGRDLPHTAWEALWDEAVAIKPSLSRPGRR